MKAKSSPCIWRTERSTFPKSQPKLPLSRPNKNLFCSTQGICVKLSVSYGPGDQMQWGCPTVWVPGPPGRTGPHWGECSLSPPRRSNTAAHIHRYQGWSTTRHGPTVTIQT